jgi:predicted Zn-dependent protease
MKPMKIRTVVLGACTAAVLTLTACETVQTTQPGVVGVTRTQRMAVSSEEIEQASAAAYSQMLQQARAKGILDRDPAQLARVRAVATRLIGQVGAFRPDARRWDWETHLFQSPQVNAFAMAGGKTGVYSGLLDKLQLTDDELAAVLGHEIAHALREHVREQVSLQAAQQLPLAILSAVSGNQALAQLGDVVADVTLSLPRSRKAELEADRIGVELAARAGYDPRAAITLWEKMGAVGASSPPAFLSTHPSPADRQAELARAAQMVMPLYREAVARR